MAKDPYTILGVSRSATKQEIKDAYRRLAKIHHPDNNGGDPASAERFKEISSAYAALADRDGTTNHGGGKARKGSGAGFDDIDMDIDIGPIFDEIFRSFPSDWNMQGFGSVNPDLSDFIRNAMQGRNSKRSEGRPHPEDGADIQYEVNLTMEQAFKGLDIQVPGEDGKITVRLRPGATVGSRLTATGKGKKGTFGGKDGNLVLVIASMTSHPMFTLIGRSLYLDLEIPFTTAAMGGNVEFTHLDGTKRTVEVQPFGDGNNETVVKGMGWPGAFEREVGDLTVRFQPVFPNKMNAKQKKLLKSFELTSPSYGAVGMGHKSKT